MWDWKMGGGGGGGRRRGPRETEAERLPGQTSGRGQDLTAGGSQGFRKGKEVWGAVHLQGPREGPSNMWPK